MFLDPPAPKPKGPGPLDGLEPPVRVVENGAEEEPPWQTIGSFDLRFPAWPCVAGAAPPPGVFLYRGPVG